MLNFSVNKGFTFNYGYGNYYPAKNENKERELKQITDSDYKNYSRAISAKNKPLISFGCQTNPTILKSNSPYFEIREKLFNIDGYAFEALIADIFSASGEYDDVTLTKQSSDGGIDLILEKDGKKTLVQCKHWHGYVSEDKIYELDYCKNKYEADNAIMIASNGVDDNAFNIAKNFNYDYKIMNLDDVIKYANENNFELTDKILAKYKENQLNTTDKEKAEIVRKLIEAGRSKPQIAKEIGCSVYTVNKMLINMGLSTPKLTIAEKYEERMRRLIDEGKTMQEIADDIGINIGSLQRVFNDLGLSTKTTTVMQKYGERIRSLVQEGKTKREISEEIGCNIHTVRYLVSRLGLSTQKTATLVEQHKERICQLVKEGKSKPQIVEEIGCSKSTVDLILKETGLSTKKPSVMQEYGERIRQLVLEGKNLQEIADEINYSPSVVHNVVKELGLSTQKPRIIEQYEKKIRELVKQGKTQKEIADEIGCNVITIRKVLRDLQLQVKKPTIIEENEERILQLLEEGKSKREIADEIGCGTTTVYRIIEKLTSQPQQRIIETNTQQVEINKTKDCDAPVENNLNQNLKSAVKTQLTIAEQYGELIRQLAENGKTHAEIADVIGCSSGTIYTILKDIGVSTKKSSIAEKYEERIRQLVEQGKTQREIMDEIGCGKTGLSLALQKLGLSTKKKLTIAEQYGERICQLSQEGRTQQEIADEIGCGIMVVRQTLKDMGVSTQRIKIVEQNKEQICQLVKEGKNLQEIADEIGCSTTTVRHALKDLNIEINTQKNIDTINNDDLLKLKPKDFRLLIADLLEKQGYKISGNIENNMFTAEKDGKISVVKCINNKNTLFVGNLRACASFIDNNSTNLILVSTNPISKSKETDDILEQYKDRLSVFTVDKLV